ncbi:MAG: N-acetyltransferase [Sporolactobacillus sp.]|jgi:predicted GNAT family acetyltransferase|nr:N-acetyltransferase [Sporolactobacillus sp.]MCI1883003.1 N-acetyltransferase [Sporolactobacillus sp.]
MDILEDRGRFYIREKSGALVGELTYSEPEPGVIAIEHTSVNSAYRGRGLAAQLTQKVVEKAISEQKKILPLCSYARAFFQRKPEYRKWEYHR